MASASGSPKECNICNNEYDDEVRCPRILPCSHCFCTECVDQLISRNNKSCPFCRKEFNANSARDLGINNAILELLKYIAKLETSADNSTAKLIKDMKTEFRKQHQGIYNSCKETQGQIENDIQRYTELKENILQDTSFIRQELSRILNERCMRNEKKVQIIEKVISDLRNKSKELKVTQGRIKAEQEKVDEDNSFKQVTLLIAKAEDTSAHVQTWIQNVHLSLHSDEKGRQKLEKEVENEKDKINVIKDILSFPETELPICNLVQEVLGVEEVNSPPEIIQGQILPDRLRRRDAEIKRLLDQGMIYATKEIEGQTKYAKISLTEDNKMCLHCLQDKPASCNAYVLEHGELLGLVDQSSKVAFLELGVSGSTIGRLYISLIADTKGAQNFTLLCTGEVGPAYKNSPLLWVQDKGSSKEYVRAGDYENGNSFKGRALLPDLGKELGRQYKREWVAGTVRGWWLGSDSMASQFMIYTKDNPGVELNAAFGKVEEGLNVLTDAISKYRLIKTVSIIDCGVVLNI